MKITRKQLRFLLEQEAKKALTKDAIKKQIVKTVGDPEPEGEGGAAGLKAVKDGLTKLEDEEGVARPSELDSDDELRAFIKDEIQNIKQHQSGDYVETTGLNETVRRLVREKLQKIGFYKKYNYGLDNIKNSTKAHDDIIGHTWLTHVKRKDSAINEVGEVLWHSLDENGHVAVYDVEWPGGRVETDIPAILLEKVKDSDDVDEAHESHGVEGHRINASINERKYKKKSKNNKSKN